MESKPGMTWEWFMNLVLPCFTTLIIINPIYNWRSSKLCVNYPWMVSKSLICGLSMVIPSITEETKLIYPSEKPLVRRSKLNSCGEVMASLHKAPYRYTQSQHPFHQLGRIAARRGGSRWGIGFLFPLRWYLQGNSNFYLITKADVDSFS